MKKLMCILFVLLFYCANFHLVFADQVDVVNVKSFGAKGDGINDDIIAFESALKSLKDWETLYIPSGTYRISKTLVILNKHRIKIRNDGVIKPHRAFSDDYLVKFINSSPDEIIPSMGMNIIMDNLTIDCEWKTRGVLFDGIYDFSIKDLHIWKPFGHGIKIIRAQEGSFWKPVIFAGKERVNPPFNYIKDWNQREKYKAGDIVKINYPLYENIKSYKKGQIIHYENKLYRSLKDFNQGKLPTDNPDCWEWIPFEYFIATTLSDNVDKNPHSDKNAYTTRNAESNKKYWRPFYPNESALEIVSEGKGATIDNVKFFNLIIRSATNNPLIRIDNIDNPLRPLKIEFYAPQIHVVTEPYINAFNKNKDFVYSYGGEISIPENFIMLHAVSSYGLKIIGGNIQLGILKRSKAIQFGTLGKKNDTGSGNTSLIFLNSFSIEGTGFGQIGVSVMPSVKTFSKWFQSGVFIILRGDKAFEVIDLHKEIP